MSGAMHFVSTLDEARQLIEGRETFFVSNCGCREASGPCKRSRVDVCLMFTDRRASGSGKRRIERAEVDALLEHAREHALIPRPFRDDATLTHTEGICFCCDDCCGYFQSGTEPCDRGAKVEKTDLDACTHCEACVPVCHFDARAMSDGELQVKREACYGCGLCVEVCPESCISMVSR